MENCLRAMPAADAERKARNAATEHLWNVWSGKCCPLIEGRRRAKEAEAAAKRQAEERRKADEEEAEPADSYAPPAAAKSLAATLETAPPPDEMTPEEETALWEILVQEFKDSRAGCIALWDWKRRHGKGEGLLKVLQAVIEKKNRAARPQTARETAKAEPSDERRARNAALDAEIALRPDIGEIDEATRGAFHRVLDWEIGEEEAGCVSLLLWQKKHRPERLDGKYIPMMAHYLRARLETLLPQE